MNNYKASGSRMRCFSDIELLDEIEEDKYKSQDASQYELYLNDIAGDSEPEQEKILIE